LRIEPEVETLSKKNAVREFWDKGIKSWRNLIEENYSQKILKI